MTLDFGKQTKENGEVKFEEALPYSWAAALNVRIRKVAREAPSSQPPPPAKLIEFAYEIEGVDAEGVFLLEDILRRTGQQSNKPFTIKQLDILYPAKAIDGTPAFASKGPAAINTFILQTNLSTLTGPQGLRAASLAPPAGPVDPNLEMLRLLWQASIVRSGGYYLFYRAKESLEGFPVEIFDNGVATITIVKRVQPMWKDLDQLGRPEMDPDPQHQLEFLFSLLGCRVEKNDWFNESIEVPADGPEGKLEKEIVDGFEVDKPFWQYTKVIPFFKFSSAPPRRRSQCSSLTRIEILIGASGKN